MGAHLAYYFCKINKVMMRKTKLLYCGPSNKSVDVVAGTVKNRLNNVFNFISLFCHTLHFKMISYANNTTNALQEINQLIRYQQLHC